MDEKIIRTHQSAEEYSTRVQDIVQSSLSGGERRLNLGCGSNKLDGWINIDSVKEFGPDIVCDVSRPLPFDDVSVDEILAEDILEHFDKYLRYVVFYQWTRVLKVGGAVTVQVPNFKKILFKYFKFGYNNFVDFIFGETMLGSNVYIGHYGNHKWGYSKASLEEFVAGFGVQPVDVQSKGLNIRLTAKKVRHITQEEIDSTKIYSYANDHGVGDAFITVKKAREKINTFYSA